MSEEQKKRSDSELIAALLACAFRGSNATMQDLDWNECLQLYAETVIRERREALEMAAVDTHTQAGGRERGAARGEN